MRKVKDITGQRFGKLQVLRYIGNYRWICKCDCGNETSVLNFNLKNTKSCGCLAKNYYRIYKNEYYSWASMKSRCLNKNYISYKDYGGRGITVCKKWLKFEDFYKDMGKRPEKMSLDRINNEKGYCKENCRWATMKQQSRNKRNNRLITFKGETKCLAEWAIKLKMEESTIRRRLRDWGNNVEKVFDTPVMKYNYKLNKK